MEKTRHDHETWDYWPAVVAFPSNFIVTLSGLPLHTGIFEKLLRRSVQQSAQRHLVRPTYATILARRTGRWYHQNVHGRAGPTPKGRILASGLGFTHPG